MSKSWWFVFTLSLSFLAFSIIFVWSNFQFFDGKLHVVFCDVGQGDGIFIRTPEGSDLLMDGGPNNKILDCISRHTPFWDRDIELMLLSHPHQDHFGGEIGVINNYKVKSFISEDLKNITNGYKEFVRLIRDIPTRNVVRGDTADTSDGVKLKVLDPTREYLRKASPNGVINGDNASLVTLLSYGNFDVFLTGDAPIDEIIDSLSMVTSSIEVLKVGHHGSKTSTNAEVLRRTNPKLAVISVGKNNRYGHPSPEVLDVLKEHSLKYFRTDEDGEVELVSDGKTFEVRR